MCTDIRLVRLADRHISGRTLDFGYEVNSKVRVVPRGQRYEAVETGTAVETLSWSNTLGFVGMDAFGFEWAICDGLNEVGLSVGTLWLPETKLPTEPPTSGDAAAIDFVHLAAWLLGTCKTVADDREMLIRQKSIYHRRTCSCFSSTRQPRRQETREKRRSKFLTPVRSLRTESLLLESR